jgi:hypothetical protein
VSLTLGPLSRSAAIWLPILPLFRQPVGCMSSVPSEGRRGQRARPAPAPRRAAAGVHRGRLGGRRTSASPASVCSSGWKGGHHLRELLQAHALPSPEPSPSTATTRRTLVTDDKRDLLQPQQSYGSQALVRARKGGNEDRDGARAAGRGPEQGKVRGARAREPSGHYRSSIASAPRQDLILPRAQLQE